ncbi:MAG: tRNA glutamyl-Q(34) synthetase GluQRS [Burkholderiales bacterium]
MNAGGAARRPPYIGRFAPSPTGPLHAGSLVAALASWLDARAQGGRWLVRIEDVDSPRCVSGADRLILAQLAACGLTPDEEPVWQSQRSDLYRAALERLLASEQAYLCGCTRSDIARSLAAAGRPHARHGEWVYPGTCRPERGGVGDKPGRSVRLLVDAGVPIAWNDRRLGHRQQDVARAVGDFVLHRADGLWAYQLAVVVDDAAQGITDVVRGEDLADNTPRQIALQRMLGLPTPRYLHTPLVLGADGEKLSKHNGAAAIDLTNPLAALRAAGAMLGLRSEASDIETWLSQMIGAWRAQWLASDAARADGMMRDHTTPRKHLP